MREPPRGQVQERGRTPQVEAVATPPGPVPRHREVLRGLPWRSTRRLTTTPPIEKVAGSVHYDRTAPHQFGGLFYSTKNYPKERVILAYIDFFVIKWYYLFVLTATTGRRLTWAFSPPMKSMLSRVESTGTTCSSWQTARVRISR